MTDEEELKARIEAAEQDLSFFSLNWDALRETEQISDEELEEGINDALDDLIDAKNKLKEKGSPPQGAAIFSLTYKNNAYGCKRGT